MSAARLLAIALLAGFVCACDGATPTASADPCAAQGACEVAGVDLVVSDVHLGWGPGEQLDRSTGMHFASLTDSVPIGYHVRNRGDATSPAASILVVASAQSLNSAERPFPIASLPPGAIDSGVVWVPAAGPAWRDSTVRARIRLNPADAPDDPVYRNDVGLSEPYLWVRPQLAGDIVVLSPELRVGQPARLVIRMANVSPHGILTDTTGVLCFGPEFMCDNVAPSFPLRGLRPGEQRADTVEATIYGWLNDGAPQSARTDALTLCLGVEFYGCSAVHATVTVLPDLEARCQPPTLPLGAPVPAPAGDYQCHYHSGANYWGFDAMAGQAYTATVSGDTAGIRLSIVDRDGVVLAAGTTSVRVTPPSSGRLYLVAAFDGYRPTGSFLLELQQR